MDTFLARQPIFDSRKRVFGYELLFRSGPENYFTAADTVMPSANVISRGMLDLTAISSGRPAFLNFTRQSLVSDFAFALPPKEVVVEVLESVAADEDVLAACRRLKKAGYAIALDDFVETEATKPLLDLADFVKVDVLATDPAERGRLSRSLHSRGIRLLAEKVETWDVFGETVNEGYRYFQGYFFSRPVMLSSKDIPGFRLNYLRLLDELNRSTPSFDRLEEIVKREASIAYRLLRRVNSAAYAIHAKVESVRHAIVLLGEREIRMCATVWAVAELGRDSPAELAVASTLRARMCERLAALAGHAALGGALFLAGLFSMLDAILERPMEEALAGLPVDADVRDLLLGRPHRLAPILACVRSYERGDWEQARVDAGVMGLAEEQVAQCYLEALAWAGAMFDALPGRGAPHGAGH